MISRTEVPTIHQNTVPCIAHRRQIHFGRSLACLLRIVVEVRLDAGQLLCVSPVGLAPHNRPAVRHHCRWTRL